MPKPPRPARFSRKLEQMIFQRPAKPACRNRNRIIRANAPLARSRGVRNFSSPPAVEAGKEVWERRLGPGRRPVATLLEHTAQANVRTEESMNKTVGVSLLIVGIALLIIGYNAVSSFTSDVSRVFANSPGDQAIW